MQQVKLIAVQCLFRGVNDYIHLVSGKELRYFVTLAHRPAVSLGEVGRSPRRIQMMHSHRPFLGVHARSEHTCRTEQHAHLALVHCLYYRFTCLVRLALLNKAYFIRWNPVVLHQLAFDFAINVPLAGFEGPQIREYELRTLLFVKFLIVFGNLAGAVARLVVRVVAVLCRIDHTHIQCHFSCIVRSNQHLRFLFRVRQPASSQYSGVA